MTTQKPGPQFVGLTDGELNEQMTQLRGELRKLSSRRSQEGTLADTVARYEADLADAKTRQADFLYAAEHHYRTAGRVVGRPGHSAADAFLLADAAGERTMLKVIQEHQYALTLEEYQAQRSTLQGEIHGIEVELAQRELNRATVKAQATFSAKVGV